MDKLRIEVVEGKGASDGIWIVGPNGEWLAIIDHRDNPKPGDVVLSTEAAMNFARELVRRWNEAPPLY